MNIVSTLITWVIPLMVAIIFHEMGHVFAVRRLSVEGSRDKSLSYNPISFVDPFGTVILPLILVLTRSPFMFGWARTLYRGDGLRNPKRDNVLISLAGPLANLLLALLAALTLAVVGIGGLFAPILLALIVVNCFLAVLNFLPIPGFDGFSVLSGLLPHPMDQQLDSLKRFSLPIMLLLFIGIPMLFPQVNIFATVINPIMDPLVQWYKGIAGLPAA